MASGQGEETRPILLIEDETVMRNLLERVLGDAGYECVCAASCEEGRAKAGDRAFGCALVDLGLPDGNGLSLVPYLREKNPWIVPVILTGDVRSSTVMDTLREGVFDYLTKPVDIATLKASVARALSHHEAIRERDRLFGLLADEREQLKVRVEEATADIREYASQLETSSARLRALVHLAQMSAEFCSEDCLFSTTLEELSRCLPIHCVAVCTSSGQDLVTAVRQPGQDGPDAIRVIVSEGHAPSEPETAPTPLSESSVRGLVEHHTGTGTGALHCQLYAQSFWGRPLCTVAFFLEPEAEVDASCDEFLRMCAHLLASEWQEARLFLYAAKQASLGNIAMEITRGILQSLTAIRTSADVVSEMGVDPEGAEGLRIVCDNVDALQRQVQEFRQLAAAGKDTFETIVLSNCVDQALEMLALSIQSRRITIVKEYESTSKCVVLNAAALSRTFLDLISGALRRVEAGGRILLRVVDAEEERIVFEIHFTGPDAPVNSSSLDAMEAMALPSVKNHPKFMLAQRTIRGCGGRLYLGQERNMQWVFRVTLPKNAMNPANVPELRTQS